MTWFYSTWSLHLLHSVGNMLLGVAFEWTHSSYISAQSQFNWPFSLYKNSRFWDESTWKTNPAKILFIWLRVINYFHAEGFVLALFLRKRLWKCKDDLNQLTGLVSRIIIPVPSKPWIIESPITSTQKALKSFQSTNLAFTVCVQLPGPLHCKFFLRDGGGCTQAWLY